MPRQMPNTGQPLLITSRRASSKPRALTLAIALPAAPTPGKITRCGMSQLVWVSTKLCCQTDLLTGSFDAGQISRVIVYN